MSGIPPQLDLLSQRFDPELALNIDTIVLPYPNARPLNNISECRRLLPASAPAAVRPEDEHDRVEGSSHAHAPKADSSHSQNPSTSEVPGPRGSGDHARSGQRPKLIDLWRRNCSDGPMSLLRSLAHQRVRVVVNGNDGLRGWMEGKLELADPQLNLVLRNVTEHYMHCESERRVDGSGEEGGGTTWRSRSVGQILLRGDSVVSVCALASTTPESRANFRSMAASSEATMARSV
jgi:small nuclear ribonucleoprotein (snRNP)-like protein